MGRFDGRILAELTGADPEGSFRQVLGQGISLSRVEPTGPLTFRFLLSAGDYGTVNAICARRGDELRILGKPGLYWKLRRLVRRPVLTLGLVFFLMLTVLLPTRVLFITVEGNGRIPSDAIVEAASACGLRFGTSRRALRSEKVKNRLLQELPDLSWAGVNTSGCNAVITVREKPVKEPKEETSGMDTIVAARDGYIVSCVTTKGNPLCVPGQTVRKGQTLISPYTDCGIAIRVTGAEGEVYAQTRREISAVTPVTNILRRAQGEAKRRFSLILGKKRINFWKDSGICTATCGRMYAEYYITLPGGFRLPVRLAVETVIPWKTGEGTTSQWQAQELLEKTALNRMHREMISGQILDSEISVTSLSGCCRLDGAYLCREMIGRRVTEKIGETNG